MKLFRRRKKKSSKSIDEILGEVTEDVLEPQDMADEHKVQHFVLERCEQMINLAKELESQKAEYRVMTSYLKDIQIIEELPEKEAGILQDTATNIISLSHAQDEFLQTAKKLTDSQYAQLERDEEQITTAIRNLQENEKYQAAVKRDMNHLEGEKNEWYYYRQELANEQKILRRLSYGLFGVLLMLIAVILVLQMGFDVDTRLLLMLLLFTGAAGGGAIYIRMQNNTSEMKKAEVNMNRAITIMNKVKFKYVHATNAVDYVCEKYHVHNSYELNYLWEQYLEAVKEKSKFERNSEDLAYYNSKLVRILRNYQLYDARVWINQPNSLVDKREMVETKHNLIERRQKLRKRIEYNMDVVAEQKEEITKLMDEIGGNIPQVQEIIESVDKLCGV